MSIAFALAATQEYSYEPLWPAFLLSLALSSPLIVICLLKGKPGMTLLGTVFHLLAWVGAIRLAKPNSWWARRRYNGAVDFYGEAKMWTARERFPGYPIQASASPTSRHGLPRCPTPPATADEEPVFRCPACYRTTAVTTSGRCAYCNQRLTSDARMN